MRRRRALAAILVLAVAAGLMAAIDSGGAQRSRARGSAPARAQARGVHARALAASTSRAGAHTARVASGLEINRRILRYTGYIAVGTPREREVALTFDDGPGPYTPRVLAVLERFHVKATFFEIGRNVAAYPRYTAELARAGMVIGDHTEEHPFLAELGPSEQASELDQAADAIQAAGAPRPLLFRPPYGSFDAATLALLRERNMLMVLWTVDTSDYALPGVGKIIYTALSGARPGAIILFHDGGGERYETVAALPRIIERLRQRGYRLVTVPELLRDDPPPEGQPPPTPLSGD